MTTAKTTVKSRPAESSTTLKSRVRVTTERPAIITDSPLSRVTTVRNVPLRTRPTRPSVPIEDSKTDAPKRIVTSRTRSQSRTTQKQVSSVSTPGPLECFEESDDPRCQRAQATVPQAEVTTTRTRQRTTRPALPEVSRTIATRGRTRPSTTEAPAYLPPDTTAFSCENPENRNNPKCRSDPIETTTRYFNKFVLKNYVNIQKKI